MAASYATADGIVRQANHATAGKLTAITLPAGCEAVMLLSAAAAGKVTYTGADAGDIGSHYVDLPADTWFTLPLGPAFRTASTGKASPIIYINHASNSGVTVIVPVL